MKPEFKPGQNIAMKVPTHEFEATVNFYRNILGLSEVQKISENDESSIVFEFGDKQLWIDKVDHLSQAEIWLEIITDNVQQARHFLADHNCNLCDEIEKLPQGFKGFWVSGPNNIIHLVSE